MSPPTPHPRRLGRRQFLAGLGAAGGAGVVLPALAPRLAFATPEEPATGDVLVVVFLRGGADG
ncbi:MAG: twin-arginine translocation signal domain-containing protein, partial [Acidimicrobiales bacterium]|nr:twin-arginine translocation signal domain-containing protein [Acidimicrobiales bacterium]